MSIGAVTDVRGSLTLHERSARNGIDLNRVDTEQNSNRFVIP